MARKLEVEIVGDASSLQRALRQSEAHTGKFGGSLSKLKYAAVGAGAAIGGGLVLGLKDSIKAGLDAQKAQARLAVSFKNAHIAIKPYTESIEKAESAGRRLGFADDDVDNALGSLITSTGSYRASLKQLAIAQDLARFKGVSLEQATKALTMAHAGSLRPLKQLGLDVAKLTDAQDRVKSAFKDHESAAYRAALADAKAQDKTATFAKVLKITTDAVKGQADAYSNTAAGAMEQFRAQVNHIEIEVGTKLLPIFTKVILWVRDHWPEITKAVQQSWAQIKPTLIALEQLIVSVVQLIRHHWSTIGPIVQQVTNIVKAQLAILTGIIRFFAAILRGDWSGAWNALKGIVLGVFHELKAMLLAQKDILLAVAKGLGMALVSGIELGLHAAWAGFKKVVTGLFSQVIDWVKGVFGIKSPSTVFHDIGLNLIKGISRGVGAGAGILKGAVTKMATDIFHGIGGFLHGGAATGSQQNRNIGQKMAAAYGWGSGGEWNALDYLWQQESGWSNTARNKKSGAYGIPQALPPTKLPKAGQASGGSNAAAQIGWGLSYIKSRYGDPIGAWAHEQSVGWYGKGGIFDSPTIIGVGESGPEAVVPLNRGGTGRPMIVNLVLDGKTAAQALIDPLRGEARIIQQRTGKPAFS